MADARRDLSAVPPSRWRVVERERRLVVIDTYSGQPTATGPRSPVPLVSPRQTRFDGSADLTTHPFYDDKAPRLIRLDPGSAAAIGYAKLGLAGLAAVAAGFAIFNPWLLLPMAIVLANPKPRAQLRAAVTRWLDRVEREAS